MTYKPQGNNHQKEAYTCGYTDAQYLGKNYNQYVFTQKPDLYEEYENGFNDWFDFDWDAWYYQRAQQVTLKGWCTNAC